MINCKQILTLIKVQAKSAIIKYIKWIIFIKWITYKHSKYNDVNIYVVITIDTEQDVDEKYKNTGTYHNIEVGIPKVLEILDNYNCKASWMITPDVALMYPSLFKELSNKGHEIGCHVHPEYFTEPSISGIQHKEYLCNISINIQREMICKASDIIEKATGKRPISFRAGKYGIDETTLNVLTSEGYLVDTSVSPNVNWSKNDGPDWSKFHGTQPYFQKSLLEVPITIIKLLGVNYWLRPSISTLSTMKAIVEIVRSQRRGIFVLNMMFHSMECINPNPYIKSELFLKRLNDFLRYLHSFNAEFITLDKLYKISMNRKNRGANVRD